MRRWCGLAATWLALASALGALAMTEGLSSRGAELRREKLEPRFEALKPLFAPKRSPRPGDWLDQHHERGQSFAEYVRGRPVRVAGHKAIDIVPIGDFTPAQRRVVELSADYVERFFGLPVRLHASIPASEIPARARRVHPSWGMEQVLTTFVLEELLVPRRPADSVAFLALSSSDLYPDPSWNFVFGQASLRDRVGVWSIYRNGNADGSAGEFRLFLLRTLKTAVHELSHMFSMAHCVAYECVLNGSNHRQEADARPLDLCPIDLQKLCWNTRCDPVARYDRLLEFTRTHGLTDEARFLEDARNILAGPGTASEREAPAP
ncbi:MAG: archaemetzincin [Myxococcota bacterium]